MKTPLIAASLFTATAAAVLLFPEPPAVGAAPQPPQVLQPVQAPVPAERPRVEVVFVLDTTGSMSGLIAAAKEKIWSIATTLAQAQHAPEVRMGLVAFRDRGDDYVTRVVDLSSDLDSMYARLMDFHAAGGGDGPESVNAALHDAVERMSWSRDEDTYRVIFLVGDAPPHMDYRDEPGYQEAMASARSRGIVVNAIQCGGDPSTTAAWQHIAGLGQGRYFRVAQDGNAVAIATPFDERLAELSAELDGTRMAWGDAETRAEQARKHAATAKLAASAPSSVLARRATFNATESGEANLGGAGDLVSDVASGRVDVQTVEPAMLPEAMQSMAPAERQAAVDELKSKRETLRERIGVVAEQRRAWLSERIAEEGGADESLDRGIFEAVKEQAVRRGLRYDADALEY